MLSHKLQSLLILGVMIMFIPFISAWEINPFADVKNVVTTKEAVTNDYLKLDFNEKYGLIQISNTLFWIETDAIVEYSLIDNTEQCWENCEARGKATLYKDGMLFEGKTFVGIESLEKSQYWIKVNESYEENVPIEYKEVCDTQYCWDEPVTYKKETKTREAWEEYNYEFLRAGNYEWKLNGTKEGYANIDFQLISNGKTLTEWAWWNGTGGTLTYDGDYTVVKFTTNGTFLWEGDNSNVSVLVVAGGGAGGNGQWHGAGGGAGGLLYNSTYFVSAQSYSITIGSGGLGNASGYGHGGNGTNSSFGTLNAGGGGGGGSSLAGVSKGWNGGSGGGGSGGTVEIAGLGISGQGYNGGNGATGTNYGAGGGGGAGASGGNGSTSGGGNGGMGLYYSINGTNVIYACGGGGSVYSSGTPGTGGCSTAGSGSLGQGTNATANYGGGGGGSERADGNPKIGGAGGSGIVIIRYLTSTGGTDNSPVVTLDEPANNTNASTILNTFSCSAKDDIKVQNISLYINGTINQTNTTVYNNTLTYFTTNLNEGVYNWTCKVWDNATIPQSNTALVRYLNVSFGSPSVTLNSPINAYNSTSQTINFNCSVSDYKNIVNMTFFINGTANQTNTSGLNASYLFTKSISDGFYNWSCDGYNIDGKRTLANARNLTIDSLPPTILVTGGNSSLPYLDLANNHTLNYTITDSALSSCWNSYNFTNRTIPCTSGTTNTTNFTLQSNVYNSTIWANDTGGNLGSRFVEWDYRMIFANASYQSSVIEGVSTSYTMNLYTNGSAITIAYFNYNGTTSYGTITNNGGNFYTISKIQNAQLVSSNTNYSFNWIITQGDFGNVTFNSNNQTVTNLGIDNCSVNGNVLYNFTMKDEALQTEINETGSNSLAQLNFQLYNYGTKTIIQELNLQFNQTNPFAICFNNSFGTEQFSSDMQLKYQADEYETEYYHIQNATIQNSSFTTNISLYDLNSSSSFQPFKIIYRDSAYLPVDGALIVVGRKYIDEGSFKEVEVPKTDDSGETIGHLVLNNVVYNFTVVKNNVILGSFNNMYAFCQTPLVSECTIELNSFAGAVGVPDFDTEADFTYSMGYLNDTRVIQSNFTIPSGSPATVTLSIKKTDALGTTICTDTLTSSSGTLSCVIPASIGNSSVQASLYKNGGFVGWGTLKLNQKPYEIYGDSLMVFISIISFMILIGIAISGNGVITLILLGLGVIVLFALNLVANNGFLGKTATILWILIALIIILIRKGRR